MNLFQEEIERISSKFSYQFASDDEYVILKNFEVRNDDVFLIGVPKSGTTWTQEMVWLIANDFNYEGAKVFIDERFPNFEIGVHVGNAVNPNLLIPECHFNSVKFVEEMKSPRFIKSHLLPRMLPTQLINREKKPKIIYVARNPQDVCLSSYYFEKNMLKSTTASLDEYCKAFMSNSGPLRNYWESVLYFWNLRHQDNVLFIKYEEMKENLSEIIQRVATFFGKSLTDDEKVKLINWLDFNSMKNNSALNHNNLYQESGFIRKGKVGEYKKEMSTEMISYFDIWIKESIKNTDYVV